MCVCMCVCARVRVYTCAHVGVCMCLGRRAWTQTMQKVPRGERDFRGTFLLPWGERAFIANDFCSAQEHTVVDL